MLAPVSPSTGSGGASSSNSSSRGVLVVAVVPVVLTGAVRAPVAAGPGAAVVPALGTAVLVGVSVRSYPRQRCAVVAADRSAFPLKGSCQEMRDKVFPSRPVSVEAIKGKKE